MATVPMNNGKSLTDHCVFNGPCLCTNCIVI